MNLPRRLAAAADGAPCPRGRRDRRRAVIAATAPPAAADRILTTQDYRVRVVPVATGLELPWGMAFIDEGRILVTEKSGRLRVDRGATGCCRQPVAGLPGVRVHGQGGLLDVTAHPQFARNGLVYWSYADGSASRQVGTEVARGRLAGDATAGYRMENVEVIFRRQPKGSSATTSARAWCGAATAACSSRWAIAGACERRRTSANHLGKIVRINADGTIPDDNPFVGSAGALPGDLVARPPQRAGRGPSPGDRRAVGARARPQGGDEINIVAPARTTAGRPSPTASSTHRHEDR